MTVQATQEGVNKRILPDGVPQWIEDATGGEIVRIKSRAGGGVSREGAEVDIQLSDGTLERGYVIYDIRHRADPTERQIMQRREVAALRSARAAGVLAPRVIAANIEKRHILLEMIPGDPRLGIVKDAEAELIVTEYMGELAKLHAIDLTRIDLQGLGELHPPHHYIRARLEELDSRHRAKGADPLITFQLRWLLKNIPTQEKTPALVHGDAGPSNFLHENGHLTAVLDWEQAHLGDWHEDIAWIWLRMLFVPFTAPQKFISIYERLSGRKVDINRVLYYRLYAQMGLNVVSFESYCRSRDPLGGGVGQVLPYFFLHLRTSLESVAELMNHPLKPYAPAALPEKQLGRFYDSALIDLKDYIVPRSTDQLAQYRAKGLARLLKYLQAVDRYGDAFDGEEMADIARLLGNTFRSLDEARSALAHAIDADSVNDNAVLDLLYRRVMRETILAAGPLGSWVEQHHAPFAGERADARARKANS